MCFRFDADFLGCASEFPSCSIVRGRVAVHTGRAVLGGDVAEAAFVFARHPCGWLVRGDPADQGSEVLFELRCADCPLVLVLVRVG